MCGLTGFIEQRQVEAGLDLVGKMAKRLGHRGPDDCGTWADNRCGVFLGHRRLAILDLSQEGHQPMLSTCGRYVVVYNGEIYNFSDIKDMLGQQVPYRGHSDTEVLLAAVQYWGLEKTLGYLDGMFALALWDRHEKCLFLARDRMGEKPLYYGSHQGAFFFGSELKALTIHPKFNNPIDRDALAAFLRYGYVPAPMSIYQGISKVPAGVCLHFPINNLEEPKTIRYWSMDKVIEQQSKPSLCLTEAKSNLRSLLRNSIKNRMVSDVPLGAFLSGGVDSSMVVALMQEQSMRAIKTFSIGFHEKAYNEANYAKQVASHLGTEHTELYVSSKKSMEVIPRLAQLYDEPFADSSQIPTFLVSQLARQHVTVALSGDGGDEVFGGYSRYFIGEKIWHQSKKFPYQLRKLVGSAVRQLTPGGWDFLLNFPKSVGLIKQHLNGDKIHKASRIFDCKKPEEIYQRLINHWEYNIVADSHYRYDQFPPRHSLEFVPWMMYADSCSYLPDDILVKVDRAAMGVSLETRVPFLDHKVVEFAWQLPLDFKVANGSGKKILKTLLFDYVPKTLIERPKMGFGVPIEDWLRGPLKEWANTLLNQRVLKQQGLLDEKIVSARWQEHLSGKRNWQACLWSVLMFQDWVAQSG